MQNLFKKSVFTLAVILTASSIGIVSAQADMKAKPEKASQEYCDAKKHHDKEYFRSEKEQWRKSLTADQQKEVANLRVSLKKALAPIKAKIDLKKAELNGLVVSDRLDKASIDKLISEVAGLKKEAMQLKYEHMVKVRGLLTAEQKTLFDMSVLEGEGRGHHR